MGRPRKYPDELRERAIRLVFEVYEDEGSHRGAVARIGTQLGINTRCCASGSARPRSTRGCGPV